MFYVRKRTYARVRTSIYTTHGCSPRIEMKGRGMLRSRSNGSDMRAWFSLASISLGIFGLAVGPTLLHRWLRPRGRDLKRNAEHLSTRRKLLGQLELARSQAAWSSHSCSGQDFPCLHSGNAPIRNRARLK